MQKTANEESVQITMHQPQHISNPEAQVPCHGPGSVQQQQQSPGDDGSPRTSLPAPSTAAAMQ
jgi:hypothetical protein